MGMYIQESSQQIFQISKAQIYIQVSMGTDQNKQPERSTEPENTMPKLEQHVP